jgi:hypothetical protein
MIPLMTDPVTPVTPPLRYTVGTLRTAGLRARWTRTRTGAPILAAQDPTSPHRHLRESWWVIDARMWQSMQTMGIREGFVSHTLLGNFFSVPA